MDIENRDDGGEDQDDDLTWAGVGFSSSVSNSVMNNQSVDWRERCFSCWRDWRVKRCIGVLITVLVLMSIVMIAVGGSKLDTRPDASTLPWFGVIIGLFILIVTLVVGVLVFRRDCFNRVDHI